MLVAIGVPVRGDTAARMRQNGRERSRAIEYIIREPEVCTARVQANTATDHGDEQQSAEDRAEPLGDAPRRCRRWRGCRRSGWARRRGSATISSAPPSPETTTARMIVFGIVLRGACVSSASSPAESNPTSTYAAMSDEASHAQMYGLSVGAAPRGGEDDGGAALGQEEQRHDEHDDADDLDEHADARRDRHEAHADDVHEGGDHQQDDAEHARRSARRSAR